MVFPEPAARWPVCGAVCLRFLTQWSRGVARAPGRLAMPSSAAPRAGPGGGGGVPRPLPLSHPSWNRSLFSSVPRSFPEGWGLLFDVCFWSRETKMRNKPKNLETGPPFASLGTRRTARPCLPRPRGPLLNLPTLRLRLADPETSGGAHGSSRVWVKEVPDESCVPSQGRRVPVGARLGSPSPAPVASRVPRSPPRPSRSARLLRTAATYGITLGGI